MAIRKQYGNYIGQLRKCDFRHRQPQGIRDKGRLRLRRIREQGTSGKEQQLVLGDGEI